MNLNRIQATAFLLFLLCLCAPELRAQDRFEQTDGPYGGTIFSAAVASDGTVYAVTGNNEVVRSENNGGSWIRCEPRGVHRVAVDSSGNVYAGFDFGVYRSTDRGRSWTRHVAGTAVPSLNSFTQVYLLEAGSTGTIYLGYNRRIYRSTDRGETWPEVLVRPDRPLVRDISVGADGSVYAGVDGGIYRSNDNGGSWNKLGLQLFASDTVALISSAPGGRMWVRVVPVYALYHSTDAGATWTPKEALGLPPNTEMRDLAISSSGVLYAGMEAGLYRSTDGGHRWSSTGGAGIERNVVPSVAAAPGGAIFAGASDLYRSTDEGGAWDRSTVGMIATAVFALEEGIDGSILAGTGNSLFRSSDRGERWIESRNGIPENVRINDLARSGGVLVASTTGAGLYRSTDNGLNWSAGNVGLSSSTVYRVVPVQGGVLLAATIDGIFRSSDAAATWSASNSGIPGVPVRDIVDAGGGILVAATRGAGIYRSIDNGASWNPSEGGAFDVNVLVITPRGTIFGAADAVLRSTDRGERWEQVTFDVATSHVAELAVDRAGSIYVATHFPVRSSDNGNTWSPHLDVPFLTNTHTRSHLAASDGSFYFGTDGAGVARIVPDKGDRWESLTSVPPGIRTLLSLPTQSSLVGPTTFAFSPAVLYAATSAGVHRSFNDGVTWEPYGPGPFAPVDITALAEQAGTNGSMLWVGLPDGATYFSERAGGWIIAKNSWPGGRAHALTNVNIPISVLYAATDHGVWKLAGEHWTPANEGMGDRPIVALQLAHDGSLVAASVDGAIYHSNLARTAWTIAAQGIGNVTGFTADPAGNLYAAAGADGIYRSTDDGNVWTKMSGWNSAEPALTISSNSHGVLFVGTSAGTLRSSDKGAVWSRVDPSTTDRVVDIAIIGNGRIFATTASGAVRRSLTSDGTSSVVTESTPAPDVRISVVDGGATGEAVIRYNLARPGTVEIALHDAGGGLVGTIATRYSAAGENEHRFVTTGLSSGTYFLRLATESGVASCPLVIVR